MAIRDQGAATLVRLAWTVPERTVPDVDAGFERIVRAHRSSIAESMFGIGPTVARRRSVCVRCRAGVRPSAMSMLDSDRYEEMAVCPACAAAIDRSRLSFVRR